MDNTNSKNRKRPFTHRVDTRERIRLILSQVVLDPYISTGHLADKTGMTSRVVLRYLNEMEAAGMIRRDFENHNVRKIVVIDSSKVGGKDG